jgi:hypothetical protein
VDQDSYEVVVPVKKKKKKKKKKNMIGQNPVLAQSTSHLHSLFDYDPSSCYPCVSFYFFQVAAFIRFSADSHTFLVAHLSHTFSPS